MEYNYYIFIIILIIARTIYKLKMHILDISLNIL